MHLPVLFRDNRFVIIDKPPGLAVHPGPRGGPSVEDGFASLSRRRDGPWLAHRLDADTSGCLVIALRHAALLAAQAAFADGLAEKTYWAVVRGRPDGTQGVIDAPLVKRSDRTGWRMERSSPDDPEAKPAATEWRLRGTTDDLSWLELRPRTGRTHQVRVHCAALGAPVLGDGVYGAAGGGLHLLARAIRLPLEPPLAATAPPPAHMRAALTSCGWRDDDPARL